MDVKEPRWKATDRYVPCLPAVDHAMPCPRYKAGPSNSGSSSESSQPLGRIRLIPTATLPHGNPPKPSLDRCSAWCESGGRGGSMRQAGSLNQEISKISTQLAVAGLHRDTGASRLEGTRDLSKPPLHRLSHRLSHVPIHDPTQRRASLLPQSSSPPSPTNGHR